MRFCFLFLSLLNGVICQQTIACAQCIEFLTESGQNFESDVGKFCSQRDENTTAFKNSILRV